MTHRFDPTLLRDYDMRGTVGETLDAADAWALGRSFGTIIARGPTRSVMRDPVVRRAYLGDLEATQ